MFPQSFITDKGSKTWDDKATVDLAGRFMDAAYGKEASRQNLAQEKPLSKAQLNALAQVRHSAPAGTDGVDDITPAGMRQHYDHTNVVVCALG